MTRLERVSVPPLWLPTLTRVQVVSGLLASEDAMPNRFSLWRWMCGDGTVASSCVG